MKRLSSALWSLAKAIAARPAKPIKPIPTKIHWTKAEKPIDEMTAEERKEFAKTLVKESLEAHSPKNSTIKNRFDKDYIYIATIILIGAYLINSNWDKIPIFGSNAQAVKLVKQACTKNISIEEKIKLATKAKNLNQTLSRFETNFSSLQIYQLFVRASYENGDKDGAEKLRLLAVEKELQIFKDCNNLIS
jgi:hypothetical protein